MPGVDPSGFFRNWTTDEDGNFVRRGLTKSETLEFQHHLLAAIHFGILGGNFQRAVKTLRGWSRPQWPMLESKEGRLQRQKRHRELHDKQYKIERNRFINPGEDFTPVPEVTAPAPAPSSSRNL